MHPILFRIPLPKMPLKLWWALAAVAAIAVIYAALAARRKERAGAVVAALVAVGAGIAGYQYRTVQYEAAHLPIYSYGVMLGLSLVVGWYLTLTLAERDGLPKETMANCYVVTALAAIVGARLLYIVTNIDEFRISTHDPSSAIDYASFFALRRGGLVAYGGFLGGYLGSWLYLRGHRIRLMPWADVAVPSLASGLLITRIGCYLFGCDFGKRLPETAPGVLRTLGTFPHWSGGTLEGGEGAPAFVKHLDAAGRGTPAYDELMKLGHSWPVHPTQIYESSVGLVLLGLLLLQRRSQRFRGQIFFLFAFAYGYLRFLIEMLRDDSERGEVGSFPLHLFIPFALAVMGVAFVFGISLGITNARARTVARVLAFVPPVVAYVVLAPAKFAEVVTIHPSTSQWIGLITALVVAYFYAKFWEIARKSPVAAMSPESLGEIDPTRDEIRPRRRRDEDEDDEESSRPRKKKKVKKGPAPAAATKERSSDDDEEEKSASTAGDDASGDDDASDDDDDASGDDDDASGDDEDDKDDESTAGAKTSNDDASDDDGKEKKDEPTST